MLDKNIVNKNIPIPLYYQLKLAISKLIDDEELLPGDMIPKELEFCEALELSRTTVRQAIQELVNEGYIYRVKGKGSFVSKPKLTQDFLNKIEPYKNQIERLNMAPSTRILSCTIIDVPEKIKQHFKPQTTKVIELIRLRYADNTPIVYLKTYLPTTCSFILEHDLATSSLYEILGRNETTKIVGATRTNEAILASKSIADILNLSPGSAIQFTTTNGYTEHGEVIEYSIAYYAGDKIKFTVNLSVD